MINPFFTSGVSVKTMTDFLGVFGIDPNARFYYSIGNPAKDGGTDNLVEVTTDGLSFADIQAIDNKFDVPSYEAFVSGAEGRVSKKYNRVVGGPDAVQSTFDDMSVVKTDGFGGTAEMGYDSTQSYDIALTSTSQSYTFYFLCDPRSTTQSWLFDTDAGRLILAAFWSIATPEYAIYDGTIRGVGIRMVEAPQVLTFILDAVALKARIYKNSVLMAEVGYTPKNIGGTTKIYSSKIDASNFDGQGKTEVFYDYVHDDVTRLAIEEQLMKQGSVEGAVSNVQDTCLGIGQSNLVGNTDGTVPPPVVPVGSGKEYTTIDDKLISVVSPVGDAVNGSLAPEMCIKFKESIGRELSYCEAGKAGSGLTATSNPTYNWEVTNAVYINAIYDGRAIELKTGIPLQSMIVLLGETDANKMTTDATYLQSTVQTAWNDLMDRLHSEFPSAIIHISEVGNYTPPTAQSGDIAMREVQNDSLVGRESWLKMAFTGAKDFTNGLHYSQEEYNAVGDALAVSIGAQ